MALRCPFFFGHSRITGILVSRFLLDLQSTNQQMLHLESSSTPEETVVFGHAIFSLDTRTSMRSSRVESIGSFYSDDESTEYSAEKLAVITSKEDLEGGLWLREG